VVTLRRVDNQGSHQPAGRAVVWSHRWIVEMHKRHQWYPSQGVHKIIFVGPLRQGSGGLPLKESAQPVRALVR
jgi:hypothetical protein